MTAMACMMFAAATAGAQTEDAFTSVSLGLVGTVDVAAGSFQDRWGRRPSFGATIALPFHVGEVEAGLLVSRHRTPAAFTSVLGFAGWGATLPLGRGFGLTGMVAAGDYFMVFDGSRTGYSRRENELALGASSMLEFRATGRFSIELGLRAFRIFTATPIDLLHLGAGLRYRISAPDWFPALMR